MQRKMRFVYVLGLLMLGSISLAADEEGFRPIFDGKTLDGWDGDPRLWRVEDGAITGETTPEKTVSQNTFIIWRGGRPADFELKFAFKLCTETINSGMQYRSREAPEWGRWAVGGYQADMDGLDQYTGILYEERGRSILAQRGEKVIVGSDHKPQVVGKTGDPDELRKHIRKGDWNDYHVIAQGNRLQHIINGQLMVDVTDDDPEQRRSEGILAIQLHAGPPMKVQVRDIRLKEVPADR